MLIENNTFTLIAAICYYLKVKYVKKMKIENPYLKYLGVVCAAHLKNDTPHGASYLFDSLLNGSQPVLQKLLQSPNTIVNPLKRLKAAYYQSKFPKLILVSYNIPGSEGHVFSVRINKIKEGIFDIIILETLEDRQTLSAPRALSEKYETYRVQASDREIQVLIDSLHNKPFEDEKSFFIAFLNAIPAASSLTSEEDQDHRELMTVLSQRQGTCQGKTFTNSLLSFCPDKQTYKLLKTLIQSLMIEQALTIDPRTLNFRELSLINEAICNLSRNICKGNTREIKRLASELDITLDHELINLPKQITRELIPSSPYRSTISTSIPKEQPPNLITLPNINKRTVAMGKTSHAFLFLNRLQLSSHDKNLMIVHLITNRIQNHLPPLDIAYGIDGLMQTEIYSITDHMQRSEHYHDVSLCVLLFLEEALFLLANLENHHQWSPEKQFIIERFLWTISTYNVTTRIQTAFQDAQEDIYTNSMPYHIIWQYIIENIERLNAEFNRHCCNERSFQNHPLIKSLKARKVRRITNGCYFSYPAYPLSHLAITRSMAWYNHIDPELKFAQILKCSDNFLVNMNLNVRSIDALTPFNGDLPPFKKPKMMDEHRRDPLSIIFAGLTYKLSGCLELQGLKNPTITNLLRLGYEEPNANHSLVSIISYVCANTTNIVDGLQALSDKHHTEALDLSYIDKLITRGTALDAEVSAKLHCIRMLLNVAHSHLLHKRYMAHSLCLDTANTLLFHLITKDLTFEDEEIHQIAEAVTNYTDYLYSDFGDGIETVLSQINTLSNPYFYSTIKVFYMLLSTTNLDDIARVQAIFINQSLLNLHPLSIDKRAAHHQKILVTAPLLKADTDLSDENIKKRQKHIENLTRMRRLPDITLTIGTSALSGTADVFFKAHGHSRHFSVVVPDGFGETVLNDQYAELVSKPHPNPINYIKSYLHLKIQQKDLKRRGCIFDFTYAGRDYSLDASGTITLSHEGDRYTFHSSNDDLCIFESATKEIIFPPKYPDFSAQVNSLQVAFLSCRTTVQNDDLVSFDHAAHPWLKQLGRVYINKKNKYLFPNNQLLLHLEGQSYQPIDAPQLFLPKNIDQKTQEQLSFFPLEAAGLNNYIPFLDHKGELKSICIFDGESHIFLNVKNHTLEPKNNDDFLYLLKFLIKAGYSEEAARLCNQACLFYLGNAHNANKILRMVINVFEEKYLSLNPYWFYVLDDLLIQTPQFKTDYIDRNALYKIDTHLYQLLPNIPNIRIASRPLFMLKMESNEARVKTVRVMARQSPISDSFDQTKLVSKYSPARNAAIIFSDQGLINWSKKWGPRIPQIIKYEEYLRYAAQTLSPFLFHPPMVQVTSYEPPRLELPSYVYPFTPDTVTRDEIHPSATLGEKIDQSIQSAAKEIEDRRRSKEAFIQQISTDQNQDLMARTCQHHIQSLNKTVMEAQHAVRHFLISTYDIHMLRSGKIDVFNDSFEFCFNKLVKIGAYNSRTLISHLGLGKRTATSLKALLQIFLWASCELRHQQNILAALSDKAYDKLYRLMSEPHEIMADDPETYPLLMYEYFSGFRARACQISLYKAVATKAQYIAELKPGSGKTSIIPAIAANQTLKGDCVIIELPLPLYDTQSQEIAQRLQGYYGLKCYHLKAMPNGTLTDLSALNEELKECKANYRVILTTVQALQSIRLQIMRMEISQNFYDKVDEFEKFLHDAYYISDEIDSEFSSNRVVNIPLDSKQPAPSNIQLLVAEAMHLISTVSDKITAASPIHGFHGALPTDTYMTAAQLERFIELMRAKHPGIDHKIINFIKQYYSVIFISQNNYALSLSESNEAVPAYGGVAIPDATFSNMITKLITTWLSHFRQKIPEQKLFDLTKILAAPIILDHTSGIKRHTRVDKLGLIFDENNLTGIPADLKLIAKAIFSSSAKITNPECPHLQDTYQQILFLTRHPSATQFIAALFKEYIIHIIFPSILSNPSKVSLGPFDHPRGHIVGLTGTTHSLPTLQMNNDMLVNQSVTGPLSGDGVCLHRMIQEEQSGDLEFVTYDRFADLASLFESSKKYQAIIDDAKFISIPDTEAYARQLFSIIPPSWGITCVLFFINNSFYGLINGEVKQINTSSKEDIESTMGVNMDKCFMIFDSARTRGCDIPLPHDARGLLTLSMNTSLAEMIQATMRFRQYGIGQHIDIVLSPDLQSHLGASPTVESLIKDLVTRDMADLSASNNISSTHQAIKAVCINTIREAYLSIDSSLLSAHSLLGYTINDKAQLFMMLKEITTNRSELNLDMFNQELTTVSTLEKLEEARDYYLSKLKSINIKNIDTVRKKMDAMIRSKFQYCAKTVASARVDTSCQNEVAVACAVETEVVVTYTFTTKDSYHEEPIIPLDNLFDTPITDIHPEFKTSASPNLYITKDIKRINRMNPFQGATMPNCYLGICGENVVILSHNDIDTAGSILSGTRIFLAGDFKKVMSYAQPETNSIFLSLCQAITCLGSALGLAQYIAQYDISPPPFIRWVKQTNNPCNRDNLSLLEIMSSSHLDDLTTSLMKPKCKAIITPFYSKYAVWLKHKEQKPVFSYRFYQYKKLTVAQLKAILAVSKQSKNKPRKFLQYLEMRLTIHATIQKLIASASLQSILNIGKKHSLLSESSLANVQQALQHKNITSKDQRLFETYLSAKKAYSKNYPKVINISNLLAQGFDEAQPLLAAIVVQRYFRGFLARKQLAIQHLAATNIQRRYRGFLVRKRIAHQHLAAKKIQKYYRSYRILLVWKQIANQLLAANKLLTAKKIQNLAAKLAAKKIQRHYRKFINKKRRSDMIKQVIFFSAMLVTSGLLITSHLYFPAIITISASILSLSILLSVLLTAIPLPHKTPIAQLKSWRLKKSSLKNSSHHLHKKCKGMNPLPRIV